MREATSRFGSGGSTAPTERRGPLGLQDFLAPRRGAVPNRSDIRKAWLIAILADWIQIVLVPFFGLGVLSPANDLLDLTIAVLMIRLLGWHPALLPTFIAELVPGLGLFPTWTISVWFATRGLKSKPQPASPPAS